MASASAEHRSGIADTASLRIGFHEAGPADGFPVLLLHGWPYGPRIFDPVLPALAAAGLRVIVPAARGFANTRFRDDDVLRSGQQAALGRDLLEFMDALGIERAVLAGYDWGNRAASVVSAIWPERVAAFVSSPGYAILNTHALAEQPGDPAQLRQAWYRFVLNTPQGEIVLRDQREALARQCWEAWSPRWQVPEDLFRDTVRALDNPDWAATSLHCYRYWYGNAPGDPALEELEARLRSKPAVTVPTIVLAGDSNSLYPTDKVRESLSFLRGHHEFRLLDGIGHCTPAEAPDAFIQAVADAVRLAG
ncbi:alpha/beta fold hydrolase [Rhizosaccharibacter radicis]|uniref:Alpha/beta hydrolase n=1 Tax=Rhizosaccharibacter radicis TaxID=2782605 RepID=A0ABT1VWY9_9PROT|nr:alpha/beta hydrolase [Acetobacteraceae bacterium KSS12]